MWTDPATLPLGVLVKLAKERTPLRLADGRIVRLVSWPTYFSKGSRGRRARVETTAGTRSTVHVRDIESVEVP